MRLFQQVSQAAKGCIEDVFHASMVFFLTISEMATDRNSTFR